MKHRLKWVCLLTIFFISVKAGQSQTEWKLGNRQVPGPLPPDMHASMPLLDTKIDVVFGEVDGVKLKLDFAKPSLCRNQKVPLVVFVHGGGWHAGDKSGGLQRNDSKMFFQLGFAVASINYRLSPQYHFPAHIHDCKLAIRFLRKNADYFGFDPDRIGIWGSSAGGHLVSLMGTADDDDGLEGQGLEGISSRVQAVVDHFGPTDLTAFSTQVIGAGLETIKNFLGCYPYDCPDVAAKASPATYVTSDDPPLIIIHGDKDNVVPYSQAEIFAEKLRKVLNACALIKVKNAGHGFMPTPIGATISPSQEYINFLTVSHLARYLEPALYGDLNMDGKKNSTDTLELMTHIGMIGVGPNATPASDNWNPLADLLADGKIDFQDWLCFINAFSQ